MKFRNKPVVIEAMQVAPDSFRSLLSWLENGGALVTSVGSSTDCAIQVRTLEGELTAANGDWIIRGVKGEFYPCKPDIFEQTYEPVEP